MNLATYRELFVHRDDVFAKQFPDGHYEPVRRPLTDDDLAEHLDGLASYGVYVIEPMITRDDPSDTGNTVTYALFDLDTYDQTALEWLCYRVELLANEIGADHRKSLLLESSGGKGYHIWLFLDRPVPAGQVRQWTAPVKDDYGKENPGTWPPLEIFPKQNEVPPSGFGNLVKLPFGVHARTGARSEIVPLTGWASDVDGIQRLQTALIPEPPAEQPRTSPRGASATGERVPPFPCIAHIVENGAPQGMRDDAMFHFARFALGQGIPEDLVLEWCQRVNEEFDPPLTNREVHTKVLSASRMASPHPGCNADWLRGFCPGGENCFASWNNERESRASARTRGRASAPADDYLSLSPEQRKLRRATAGWS